MTNPIAAMLQAVLADAMGEQAHRQTAPDTRHQFKDLHQVAHFLRDRVAEELARVMVHTNLPQLLVGDPTEEGGALTIEGACEDAPSDREFDTGERNPFTVTVKRDGETVMVMRTTFWPQVD